MSINYSSNQYRDAYVPSRLRNWQLPKEDLNKKPSSRSKTTKIVVNEKNHVYPDKVRPGDCSWGHYVGTWDLPLKIPGPKVENTTARKEMAVKKLLQEKEEADYVIYGRAKAEVFQKNRLKSSQQMQQPSRESIPEQRSGARCPTGDVSPQPAERESKTSEIHPAPESKQPTPQPTKQTPSPPPPHGIPHVIPSDPCPCDDRQPSENSPVANEKNVLSPSTAYRNQAITEEA